jgi:hypothetical protein
MEETTSKSGKTGSTSQWIERLRGRSRMAVAAIGGVFLFGFLGISRPLGQRIDGANDRLAKANDRAQLAGEVGDLRQQAKTYQQKLQRGVDPNEWTNYLLNGIRKQQVRLVRMDPKETLSLGPCKVLAWQIDLDGSFESLGKVVQWLETGQRLVRVDRLLLKSAAGGTVGMSILVKGLALDVPAEKLKEEKLKAEKAKLTAAKRATNDEKLPDAIRDAMPQPPKLPDGMKLPPIIQQALQEAQPR